MEMTQKMIKDVNQIINDRAESYFEELQEDDEGHLFQMNWQDCIEQAKDDLNYDPSRYLRDKDYELTDGQYREIADWAYKNVTWETIKENV